ncbi:hypothetical protein SAMN05421538_107168, partial [Paracoccus isoporae]
SVNLVFFIRISSSSLPRKFYFRIPLTMGRITLYPNIISLGGGADTMAATHSGHLIIRDMDASDFLFLGGAFADRNELEAASRIAGKDLVLEMPGSGQITIVGGASLASSLAGQVIDLAVADQLDRASNPNVANGDKTPEIKSSLAGQQLSEAEEALQTVYGDLGAALIPKLRSDAAQTVDNTGIRGNKNQGEQMLANQTDSSASKKGQRERHETDEEDEEDLFAPSDRWPYNELDDNPVTNTGCFIATAVYGNPFHPDVMELRRFRERVLRRYLLGRLFIHAYNIFGPMIAKITSEHHAHAKIIRLLLTYFVRTMR